MQALIQALLNLVAQLEKPTSTAELAETLGKEQQSVSRVLDELERDGLLQQRRLASGLHLTLTPRGVLALPRRPNTQLSLQGVVTSGLGEGKYYVSRAHYEQYFTVLLGGEPFPGTLNLRVAPVARRRFLRGALRIPGYRTPTRTYGAVLYVPVLLGTITCGLLVPERSSYEPDKVELIATLSLRRELGLADGDKVVLERIPE